MRQRILGQDYLVFEYKNIAQPLTPGFLDDGSMRKSAADMLIGRRGNRRKPTDSSGDAGSSKVAGNGLPAIGGFVRRNAGDRVQEVKGNAQLLQNGSKKPLRSLHPEMGAKMLNPLGTLPAQLAADDHATAGAPMITYPRSAMSSMRVVDRAACRACKLAARPIWPMTPARCVASVI